MNADTLGVVLFLCALFLFSLFVSMVTVKLTPTVWGKYRNLNQALLLHTAAEACCFRGSEDLFKWNSFCQDCTHKGEPRGTPVYCTDCCCFVFFIRTAFYKFLSARVEQYWTLCFGNNDDRKIVLSVEFPSTPPSFCEKLLLAKTIAN